MALRHPSISGELKRVRAAVLRGRHVSYLWTFIVGIYWVRTVTVRSTNLDDARLAAKEKLDQLAVSRREEAPVAWDLTLLQCRMSPR